MEPGDEMDEPTLQNSQDKLRRNPNFSEAEKVVILQFVQDHKRQLMGKAGRPGHGDDKVEERKAAAWKKCAAAVNQVGGNNRDWRKVKKQWQSLQDKAKRTKHSMGRTGGGPMPKTSASTELAMEVMARESLEGIRGKGTELDPTGQLSPEVSQDSSQESIEDPAPSTSRQPSNPRTAAVATDSPVAVAALQQQVNQLQNQMETITAHPSTLQRATEIRQLKFQEELLKLERSKVNLMAQSLEVQKKMLTVFESGAVCAMLNTMSEQ